jgi:hypothetical protein
MTDADLKKQLAALPIPAPDPVAYERALHRSWLAVGTHSATAASHRPRLLGWQTAAIALPLLLLAIGWWLQPSPITDPDKSARQLLAQLVQLFPGQINAVVDYNGTVKLDLADATTSAIPVDQAVVIELRREGRLVRIFAYSGRPVNIAVAGLSFRMDALLTANGGVLLATDNFVWSTAQPANADLNGWSISARSLITSS